MAAFGQVVIDRLQCGGLFVAAFFRLHQFLTRRFETLGGRMFFGAQFVDGVGERRYLRFLRRYLVQQGVQGFAGGPFNRIGGFDFRQCCLALDQGGIDFSVDFFQMFFAALQVLPAIGDLLVEADQDGFRVFDSRAAFGVFIYADFRASRLGRRQIGVCLFQLFHQVAQQAALALQFFVLRVQPPFQSRPVHAARFRFATPGRRVRVSDHPCCRPPARCR